MPMLELYVAPLDVLPLGPTAYTPLNEDAAEAQELFKTSIAPSP